MGSGDPLPLFLSAADLARRGDDEAARAALEAGLARAGDSELLHAAAAFLRYVLGDYQDVLDQLDRAAAAGGPAALGALNEKLLFCQRLGWSRDAVVTGERLLALDRERADVLASLCTLLAGEAHPAAALRHLEALIALGDSRALRLEAAELAVRAGRPDVARGALRAALELGPGDAALHMRLADLACLAGDFALADAQLDAALALAPRHAPAHLARGRLALWRAEPRLALAAARAALAAEPGSGEALRLCGAALVLGRHPRLAMPMLERALAAQPADAEALAWRGEARLRLGDRGGAAADLAAALAGSSQDAWIGLLVAELCRFELPDGQATRVEGRRLGDLVYTLSRAHGLWAAVSFLVPGAEQILAGGSESEVHAALEQALAALGGNRTLTPTRRAAGGLEPVPIESPRDPARRCLELIRAGTAADALEAFDRCIAVMPRSALPWCYRGELHLWLGDYPQARRDLEQALRVNWHTRWAYYGLAAVELVENDPAAALAQLRLSVERMQSEGPAIHVYRGEALRRLGDAAAALPELVRACALHPTRVAAWINLGLVRANLGDAAGHVEALSEVRHRAPTLLSDAARSLGDRRWARDLPPEASRALLERALLLMRGCRASAFTSHVTMDGVQRVLAAAPGSRFATLCAARPQIWQRARALIEQAAARRPIRHL